MNDWKGGCCRSFHGYVRWIKHNILEKVALSTVYGMTTKHQEKHDSQKDTMRFGRQEEVSPPMYQSTEMTNEK